MTQSKDTFTFNGFEPANTTPVPDVLFDVLLPYLNEAQLKVMLYIIRRTLGFKKTADAISLNQFRWGITTKEGKKLDDGCGLKNFTTISNALKELEQMNCIESDKRETEEGNKLTTVYRIRFRGTTQNVVGTTDNGVGVLRKTYDRTTSSGGRVLRQTESQETVIQQTDTQETVIQERESIAPESDTPTVAPPVVGDSRTFSSSGDAFALPDGDYIIIERLPDGGQKIRRASGKPIGELIPIGMDTSEGLQNLVTVDAVLSQSENEIPVTYADCLAYLEQQGVTPRGDAVEQMIQARTLYAHKHPRNEYRARPGLSEHPDDQLPGEYWPEDPDKAVEVPIVSKPLVESAQQNHGAEPPNGTMVGDVPLSNPPAQGAASSKWNVEAMVADAERLREKPFSAIARPKETKKAQVLFKRKPDLTQEEFEDAWKNWDTDWWRKTNGPFTLTDLAATPKDKSEMRLILALEKLALARANPRQSSQFVSVPRVKVFSSYDDPNFRSDQDFYPVEGGSYATAVV